MKIMYDAVAPLSIPEGVSSPDYAMGYINGTWPSFVGMKIRFPNAIPVSISAIPDPPNDLEAMGCDGEEGDYSPPEAADFSRRKLALGIVPFEYCSLAAWPDYQQACTDIGINPTQVDWLVAAYPGNGPVLYPGAIGHQWIDRGSYDESVIVDGWQPGRPVVVPTEVDVAAGGWSQGTQNHIVRENEDNTLDHWWQDTSLAPPANKWNGPERIPNS
jgi:hypothetical protein